MEHRVAIVGVGQTKYENNISDMWQVAHSKATYITTVHTHLVIISEHNHSPPPLPQHQTTIWNINSAIKSVYFTRI